MRTTDSPTWSEAGFTLIEAMLALLIACLLLGVAVPAWSSASEAARAVDARGAMQATLDHAMRHAALSGHDVVLCPGAEGACLGIWDWSGGWFSWSDLDGDRVPDPGEPVLRRQAALPGRVHLRSTRGRRRLVLHPHGGAAAGTNVTFTLCDGRGPARAVSLVLASSGRLHASAPSSAAARACMAPP
ncbi:MAG: GspH/FimT family protein [Luteimonas sp.]|jgi:type IV fimbrial biogenesis protein FimT